MKKKSRKRSMIPPELLAASNPEEFKFCFALYDAAGSGRMPTKNPSRRGLEVVNYGTIVFSDTPLNRGMLAVGDHFWETRKRNTKNRFEFMALCNRLMAFSDFIVDSLRHPDPRLGKYLSRDGDTISISEALIEAAAVVEVGTKGFVSSSLLEEAERIARKA